MPTRCLVSWVYFACCALIPSLVQAKSKWVKTEIPGMSVLSESSERTTRKLLEELSDARATLELLFPSFARKSPIPLQVYIFDSAKSFAKVAPLYEGKAKAGTVGMYRKSGYTGPALIIVADGERDYLRSIVFHEYVHHLLHQPGINLPPWLDEGFAELFSTIEREKNDRVVVGKSNRTRLYRLQNSEPIPFDRFFQIYRGSPEYSSGSHQTSVFYAQAWAFTHFLMHGEHGFPKDSYHQLFNRATKGKSIGEADIQELLGVDYAQLDAQLSEYCRKGRFTQLLYQLPPSASVRDATLKRASEGEIELMRGSLLLSIRGPQEAYPYLVRASKLLGNDSTATAYLGYHAMSQKRWDDACNEFAKAVDIGGDSPYLFLNYATSKIRDKLGDYAFVPNALDRECTLATLRLLFRARELAGGFSEELYMRIGEVWLSSTVRPEDKHMSILIEGQNLYPNNEWIAFYLAHYFAQNQRLSEAKQLVELFENKPINHSVRRMFADVLQLIDAAASE